MRLKRTKTLVLASLLAFALVFAAGCGDIGISDADENVQTEVTKKPENTKKAEATSTPKPTATTKPTEAPSAGESSGVTEETGETSGETTGTVETGTTEGSVTEGENTGVAYVVLPTPTPDVPEDDSVKVDAAGNWSAFYAESMYLLRVGEDPELTPAGVKAFAEMLREELRTGKREYIQEGLYAGRTAYGYFVENGIDMFSGGESGGKLDGTEMFHSITYDVSTGEVLAFYSFYAYVTEDKNFLFIWDEPITSDEAAWNTLMVPYIRQDW